MISKIYKYLSLLSICAFGMVVMEGCKIYTFKDISIPSDVKTVKVNFIENRARYVNPRLSPEITNRLQQKIISQTRLQATDNASADWVISGYVSGYDISTSGISNRQSTSNRLNVTIAITLMDNLLKKKSEFNVVRSFDFNAGLSLQEGENQIGDDLLKGVSDEIFNKIFSNW